MGQAEWIVDGDISDTETPSKEMRSTDVNGSAEAGESLIVDAHRRR